MSEENVELVRRFIDAFSRRDRETFAALLHPEVEWHTFMTSLLGIAGTMHGRDELLRATFERVPEVLDDWHSAPLEVKELADGQVLSVACYEARGSSSGAEITIA
jgi:ketosteroid isomerase-like protein